MIERQRWVDHIFNLDIDVGWTKNVMSRISDTEIRLKLHTQSLSDTKLSQKNDQTWSIKEHIGHLTDLEKLWMDRFGQIDQGLPEMVMADMENTKTQEANHNDKNIDLLIKEFSVERKKLTECFNNLSEKSYFHKSLHPRIKAYMKPVDLLFFIAEHDDHHITSITELASNF